MSPVRIPRGSEPECFDLGTSGAPEWWAQGSKGFRASKESLVVF